MASEEAIAETAANFEYLDDTWPIMADGCPYDGKHLMKLVREGKSPSADVWDVDLLFKEAKKLLGAAVIDVPMVYEGAISI